jgi:hypothetical protein
VGAGLAATYPSLSSSLYGPNSQANANTLNGAIPGLTGGSNGSEFGMPEAPDGFSSFGGQ